VHPHRAPHLCKVFTPGTWDTVPPRLHLGSSTGLQLGTHTRHAVSIACLITPWFAFAAFGGIADYRNNVGDVALLRQSFWFCSTCREYGGRRVVKLKPPRVPFQ